jgi:hypothetical protein
MWIMFRISARMLGGICCTYRKIHLTADLRWQLGWRQGAGRHGCAARPGEGGGGTGQHMMSQHIWNENKTPQHA